MRCDSDRVLGAPSNCFNYRASSWSTVAFVRGVPALLDLADEPVSHRLRTALGLRPCRNDLAQVMPTTGHRVEAAVDEHLVRIAPLTDHAALALPRPVLGHGWSALATTVIEGRRSTAASEQHRS